VSYNREMAIRAQALSIPCRQENKQSPAGTHTYLYVRKLEDGSAGPLGCCWDGHDRGEAGKSV